jgi:predicted RecB family nuclease
MSTLTTSQLRLLTLCERRVWLDKYGNRYEPLTVTTITTIGDTAVEIPVASWADAVAATHAGIRQKYTIIGACLEAEIELQSKAVRLITKIDRLQPAPDGTYYPVEIKQHATLTAADTLQMDLACFLVGQMQAEIPHGEFHLGTEAQIIHHHFNRDRFYSALKQWANTIQQQNEPPVVYASHCRTCHWHDFCINELKKQRSIQLLHSIRRDAVKSLAANGIHTVDQFALLSLEEIRKFKGIKSTAERYLAQARAYVNDEPQWYQPMPDILQQGGTMFDLETVMDREDFGTAWSLGWCDTYGTSQIAIVNAGHKPIAIPLTDSLMVHVVRHADDAWYTLLDSIGHLDTPIYHWTGFDAGVMANTAPTAVKQALLPRMHDLYKTFTDTVQLPVRSYSIKVVAAYFGFQWQGYAAWDAAYNDYKLWKFVGDEAALQRACTYQRDDVLALVKVWQWMVANKGER